MLTTGMVNCLDNICIDNIGAGRAILPNKTQIVHFEYDKKGLNYQVGEMR